MSMEEVDSVIDNYSGRSRTVLDYCVIMKNLVDSARQDDFKGQGWDTLAELVDVEKFERVGNFKEVMNWQDYIGFLGSWAPSSDWECSFKRITEMGNVVFLELEERSQTGDYSSVVNSMSVYEFNCDGKIEHIDIYLQMPMPSSEMLKSYDGVPISG